MAELVLRLRDRELSRTPLMNTRVTVGRDASCDVVIDNAGVSRTHAILIYVDDQFRVRDADSQNGLLVNGKPAKDTALQYGDVIGIGKFELQLCETAEQYQLQAGQQPKPKAVHNVMGTLQMDAATATRLRDEAIAKAQVQRSAASAGAGPGAGAGAGAAGGGAAGAASRAPMSAATPAAAGPSPTAPALGAEVGVVARPDAAPRAVVSARPRPGQSSLAPGANPSRRPASTRSRAPSSRPAQSTGRELKAVLKIAGIGLLFVVALIAVGLLLLSRHR